GPDPRAGAAGCLCATGRPPRGRSARGVRFTADAGYACALRRKTRLLPHGGTGGGLRPVPPAAGGRAAFRDSETRRAEPALRLSPGDERYAEVLGGAQGPALRTGRE